MKKLLLNSVLLLFLVMLGCSTSETPNPTPNNPDSEVPADDDTDGGDPSGANTVVDAYGQLSVSGKNLVDKNGTPIQLRGMSLSWSNWWPQFYTAEVVKWLKDDFNVTIIRTALGVQEPGGYLDDQANQKEKVFTVIEAAIAEGIYVLVDWHSHHAEDNVEEAKAFFTEVAQKYGDQPNILYETYNEPLDDVSWTGVIKPYHETIIAEIRKYDSDNVIIAGTRAWSTAVDEVIGNEIDDANIMYTFHYYASSHKQDLRDIAQIAIDAEIPIFVTEHGVTEYTGDGFIDVPEANTWWDFLDENKISWLNWSISDKEESSAAVRPGASPTGGWPDNMLTQSGLMTRAELRAKNPTFGN